MIIYSNFYDYYDCCQSRFDDDIVYRRETIYSEIPGNNQIFIKTKKNPKGHWSSYEKTFFNILWFCGKFYLQLDRGGAFISLEDATNMACGAYEKKEFLGLYDKAIKNISKVDFLQTTPIALFEFGYDVTYIWQNPIISKSSSLLHGRCSPFIKVFGPRAAYEEIRRFLMNIPQGQKVIPEISDEVMAEIKGFDKFSFRKDKHEKAR